MHTRSTPASSGPEAVQIGAHVGSRVLPAAGMFWLIAGGVLYTVGGVLYAVKWPGRNNPRFGCHEIFHVFIVLGSVSHFILMYSVVAPL